MDLRNKIAASPLKGVIVFLIALKIYAKNQEWIEYYLLIDLDRGAFYEGDVYRIYSKKIGYAVNQDKLGKNINIPD